MKHPADPEAELQSAIRDRRAVIVAGTGVSLAASRDPLTGEPHPQASWVGLLQNGLEWLRDHDLMAADEAAAHLTLIKKRADTHHFISAAQDVTRHMGGAGSTLFADWLARTVGTIRAHDRKGLDALEALRAHGNLLATTNYDGLLLDDAGMLKPVTWKEPGALLRAARNRETDKVIFLHGYWRQPESVVLDWRSYEQLTRDERHRDDLAAVWQMTTWVYVGCGVSGLSDPDFGLLLDLYGKRARQAGLWDFCLVRSSQREEFQRRFDELKINICAVSIGDSHEDLPKYLRSLLPAPVAPRSVKPGSIPRPPAFYAEPDYIASHTFVGRDSQLQDISDWAKAADPTNLLLFDAIGGNGKSMLAWEWTTKHATVVRSDWAGRFWYSFYERGAVMADFCRRALAYMTGRPLEELEKLHTPELAEDLLAELHARPWLVNLDGLERVLVAYHRIDAAEVPDEEANAPTDKVLNRNPCDTIRDEDGDLLRKLAGATPSKILASSRLTPRVLLNASGQPIPGAKRITLPGLRPADAEQLLRSCGVTGDCARIQDYLTTNCDNHPLVIGVLAGLIVNYLPNRGNFDAWSSDTGPQGGATLDLARLNLIQRRNHILRAALDALPEKSRQLLSTLALVSESVDYETLAAFNPHVPPEPEEVEVPEAPEDGRRSRRMSDQEKAEAKEEYQAALARRKDYEEAVKAWRESAEVREAPGKLTETVRDLEERGLLQYDGRTRRHDLHPVVRGVAAGGMKAEDRERYGQRVVDHFSSLPHNPYEQARTLEDVAPGLHVVRTLLKLGRFQEAATAYRGDLAEALVSSLEAHVESLSLLRPFFPAGWGELAKGVGASDATYLTNSAAIALRYCGQSRQAIAAYGASLQSTLEREDWTNVGGHLNNISEPLIDQNLLAKALRGDTLALELASVRDDKEDLFTCRLHLFLDQARLGEWEAAAETWRLLDAMGRAWSRASYRQGSAERLFAFAQFWQGTLQEQHLTAAARLAEKDNNRTTLRILHRLRGAWRLEHGEWALVAASFHEAVRMARERRLPDAESEAGLALAKLHLGQLGQGDEARQEAQRLAGQRNPHHRYLAMLWRAIGDHAQAQKHALAAYQGAWADGEPYVFRYELTKTTELLNELNVPIPVRAPYDPAKDEPLPWEAAVRAAIEKLRATQVRNTKSEARNPK